jgi:hypothetical protein
MKVIDPLGGWIIPTASKRPLDETIAIPMAGSLTGNYKKRVRGLLWF